MNGFVRVKYMFIIVSGAMWPAITSIPFSVPTVVTGSTILERKSKNILHVIKRHFTII